MATLTAGPFNVRQSTSTRQEEERYICFRAVVYKIKRTHEQAVLTDVCSLTTRFNRSKPNEKQLGPT